MSTTSPRALPETFIKRLLPRLQAPGTSPGVPLIRGAVDIGLCIEGASAARTVTDEDLTRWQVNLETLLPIAEENLRSRSRVSAWCELGESPGIFFYACDDGLGASRAMFIDRLLSRWRAEGFLVGVPSPDLLMVLPLVSAASLRSIPVFTLAAVNAHDQSTRALSDQLFWYKHGSWSQVFVEQAGETIRLLPSPDFLSAVEKLVALEWTGTPAFA